MAGLTMEVTTTARLPTTIKKRGEATTCYRDQPDGYFHDSLTETMASTQRREDEGLRTAIYLSCLKRKGKCICGVRT